MSYVLEAPSQRVGEQLLGHRRRRTARAGQSACRSATGPSTFVPSASSLDASIGARGSLRPPGADGVEVLQREAERVHELVAAGARRVGAMLLHLLAHRQRTRPVRCSPSAAARSAAAPAAACRAGCRESTCRAAPARCGWAATSRSGCCRGRAGRAGRRRSPARAGTGCRRRRGCRSAARAARSRTCSRRSAAPSTLRSSRITFSSSSSVSRWKA